MQYCPSCGRKLSLGNERFCPNCGQNITQEKEEANGIGIIDTKGDVIGVGVKGTGNIIGKDIDYTVQGNVIHLNISGGNLSNEFVDSLQKIINTPTQIDQKSLTKETEYDTDKLDETNNIQKQIRNILQEVENIEKKEGTAPIEEIRSENIQISRKELELKVHILKGNEYYYKKEYNKAIQCYDKAIEIKPNNAEAWNNKGNTLYRSGKHNEAIHCYDKAIEIKPNNADAWYNKGNTLYRSGKHNEAIHCYDKVLAIEPNYGKAWNNKGNAYDDLGKPNEAFLCYDKALEIEPNNELFNKNRNTVLEKLRKNKQI